MAKHPFPFRKTTDQCRNGSTQKLLWVLPVSATALLLILLFLRFGWPLQKAQPIKGDDLILFAFEPKMLGDIDQVPNTCGECVLERKSLAPGRLYLVTLNDGQLHSFEMREMYEPPRGRFGYMSIRAGQDAFSDLGFTAAGNPDLRTLNINLDKGMGAVSLLRAKSHFCDSCIKEMLEAAEGSLMVNAVIWDDETGIFYSIHPGVQLQVGDCVVTISQEQQEDDITIQVEYS